MLSRTWPAVLAIVTILGIAGSAWAGCVPYYKDGKLRGCRGSMSEEDYSECRRGDAESCQYLEQALANNLEISPMVQAAIRGHLEEVRRLLNSSSGTATPASAGGNALLAAVRVGQEKVVRLLLEHKVPVDSSDKQGNTALLLAAATDRVSIAQALLDAGANPNVLEKGVGSTALITAAYAGNRPMAKLLLERGADPNIRTRTTGTFALEGAVSNGDLEIIHLLLKHGADPALKNSGDRTAADIARSSNKVEAAQILERAQGK